MNIEMPRKQAEETFKEIPELLVWLLLVIVFTVGQISGEYVKGMEAADWRSQAVFWNDCYRKKLRGDPGLCAGRLASVVIVSTVGQVSGEYVKGMEAADWRSQALPLIFPRLPLGP